MQKHIFLSQFKWCKNLTTKKKLKIDRYEKAYRIFQSFAVEKHRFDLDVMCNRITKKSQISSSTDSHSERYNHARDTRRFPRSLFDDFYIAGNKILLSCITNGVPCAVKIVRGTRNCCSRRASVLNGLLFEKIIARVRAAFRSRGCVQRGYADTIIIRFSDKVKSLPEKKNAAA